MRCSGWTEAVDAIERSDNLIYVPDATQSAVAAWVFTSGLTMEEAALIQPGYYWAAGQFDASSYEPGEATLEKDGLGYSNFVLQSTGNSTIAGLGLSAGKGKYTNPGSTPFPEHIPDGTHWIAIGGTTAYIRSPLHSLNASSTVGQTQLVVVAFDVAPIAADQRINGISESNYPCWQGFHNLAFTDLPPSGSIYSLNTTAYDGATPLLSLNVNQFASTPGSFFTRRWDTGSFAPQQQVHVLTSVSLQNGPIAMDTYLLDFNVVTVPEPTTGRLVALVMVACFRTRKRGRRAVELSFQS